MASWWMTIFCVAVRVLDLSSPANFESTPCLSNGKLHRLVGENARGPLGQPLVNIILVVIRAMLQSLRVTLVDPRLAASFCYSKKG